MPEVGFGQIKGQNEVKENLSQAAREGRPAHAYILEGDTGSGRGMLARAFAMSLLCERFAAEGRKEPCGECHSCIQFLSDNHPDVRYVTHEKVSLGVDDIRFQLVNDVAVKPYSSPYKIYIVRDAEKMTPQAQNALLKTLEEPPSYVVILLLTTNAEMFLPTIRSRCITLPVKPLSDEQVEEVLRSAAAERKEEGEPLSREEVRMLASFSRGSIGRGLELLASGRFRIQEETALAIATEDLTVNRLLNLLKNCEAADYPLIAELVQLWFRDLLVFAAGGEKAEEMLFFRNRDRELSREAGRFTMHGLEQVLRELEHARAMLTGNVKPENVMEYLTLTIKENRI